MVEEVRSWKTPVHLDIVDGVFAKPKSATGSLVSRLLPGSEVHLMVQNPLSWKKALLQWKPSVVILHPESDGVSAMVAWCNTHKIRVRLAISIATELERVHAMASKVSGFHVMMGKIGKYGSALQPKRFVLVAALHEKYPKKILSVDVGITADTWKTAQRAGASVAAVGSAIFTAKNPHQAWLKLSST
jgi:pentose-5-phosphate-3-epimerase